MVTTTEMKWFLSILEVYVMNCYSSTWGNLLGLMYAAMRRCSALSFISGNMSPKTYECHENATVK
jgi:hypothetical protein